MKADFSRLTFNARKHYAGVFEQQGRVRLEADGNEEVFIRLHREQQEAIDVIGHCGVPEPGNAFRITPIDGRADNFAIAGGPGALGRCYVEGLMCELEQSTTYLEQPDLPNPDPLPLPSAGDEAAALVYLEVWQRLVTYLEDEAIREVGLGGPDTATRLRTVAQVKVIPVRPGASCASAAKLLPSAGRGTLTTLQPADMLPPDPCRLPDPASYTGRENHLYRVEIHDGGDVMGAAAGAAFQIALDQDALSGAVAVTLDSALSAAQRDALERSGAIVISDDRGRVERVPLAQISNDNRTITLARGLQTPFLTADNAQVSGGAARFKWSRDNASFAVAVTAVAQDRQTLTVAALGRDQATALREGDLVEISDDASELGPGRGHLTYLKANPDPDLLTVVLADPLPAAFGSGVTSPPTSPLSPPAPQPSRHMILRRWDGLGAAAAKFDETATPEMNLGDGVHIQFGGSDLRPGDFWIFAARAIDGSLEKLTEASPMGIVRHRCPLAIIRWSFPQPSPASPPSGRQPVLSVVSDCRKIFPPLTSIPEPGFHITRVVPVGENGLPSATPLANDSNVPVTAILGGINVECDAAADPVSVDRPTCWVTVDVPLTPAPGGPPSGGMYDTRTIMADVAVSGNSITWRPRAAARAALQSLPQSTPPGDRGILARLTLKGSKIWALNNPSLFLDGEAFGLRQGNAPDTALRLPSGDGRRGGDFEMWFWLGAPPPAGPIVIDVTTLTAAAVRAEGIAEAVAELRLSMTGGNPTPAGTPVAPVNIQIFANTAITSPVIGQFSDVVLLVDNPTALNTTHTGAATPPPVLGIGGSGLNYASGSAPNVFLARPAGNNSVVFTGVPLDPGVNGRLLRILNLRVDASALGAGAPAPTAVTALVSIQSSAPITVNNPTQSIGTPVSGVAFSLRTPSNTPGGPFTFSRQAGLHSSHIGNPPFPPLESADFLIQLREQHPTSFRPRLQEEGFTNAGPQPLPVVAGGPLPPVGRVSSGTRFRIVFTAVPANVRVFVSTRDMPVAGAAAPLRAVLLEVDATGFGLVDPVPGQVPPGTGGATVAGVPLRMLTVVEGAATVFYEWVSAAVPPSTALEEMNIGVVLAARGNSAGQGMAIISAGLFPISTVHAAAPLGDPPNGQPVPRFIDVAVRVNAFNFA